jgi:uncharacterized lipoprotein YbaY
MNKIKKLLLAAALCLFGCEAKYSIPTNKQVVPVLCKQVVEEEDEKVVIRAGINVPPNVVVSP